MDSETQSQTEATWFHEEDGQRKGPVTDSEIIAMIKSSRLLRGTPVWKKGFPDWMKVENTELRTHLDDTTPPPLSGEHVSNTLVWVLAFAPLIGAFLEGLVATVIHGNATVAEFAVQNGKYWLITVALNVGLGYLDESRLRRAGHDTSRFKGWAWLVPVYLYQRYKSLKQGPAYFIVWIVCFVLTLLE